MAPTNTNTIQARATAPPTPWKNSSAKQQLYDDIMSGRTSGAKNSTEVYYSRPCYQRYELKNFQTNYGNLKRKIKARKEMANAGKKAYKNDHPLIIQHRTTGQNARRFYYNGSIVQQQLKRDVQRGLTDGKKPAVVMASRAVYQNQSGLGVRKFSDHLSYERRLHQRRLQDDDYRDRMRFVNAEIRIEDD